MRLFAKKEDAKEYWDDLILVNTTACVRAYRLSEDKEPYLMREKDLENG